MYTCPNCNREYPDSGNVRCICKANRKTTLQVGYNPEWPCELRGESLGILDCGCAGKPKVYHCPIFGVCSLRRMKPNITGYLNDQGEKVECEITYCNRCEKRKWNQSE